jgi:Zn-dependent dipeptidase, microsomal dipeptidase homolog
MLVFDSHCDAPSQMMRARDYTKDNPWGHVDFPKLRAGGVDASVFALYCPPGYAPDEATRYTLDMLAHLYDQVDAAEGEVEFAFTASEVLENKSNGLTSILIGMENGAPIQHSLPLLRLFYRMGVIYMTLAHNADNEICDSCAGNHRWGGLSPFGREVVREMNNLGMIVDIAHCSDDTVRDCLELSRAPIVSTHSCCKALAGHRRNLPDDLLKAIADKGGVVQINFCPSFLSEEYDALMAATGAGDRADNIEAAFIADPENPEKVAAWVEMQRELEAMPRPSYKDVVDHIDHAVKVMGIDHVGVGTDYDGISVAPAGLENVSRMPVLWEEMRSRGYSSEDIEKVAGKNFLRVMEEVQRVSSGA